MGDLQRFRTAQDASGTYNQALTELRRGRKTSHWMWFVFPQLRGLGHSAMAVEYGLADLVEARDYVTDDVLGPRLRECCDALMSLEAPVTAVDVFGSIDAMKLRSSMTLFEAAAPAEPRFGRILERFFADERDDLTLRLLS